jgi:hypothetical protein
MSGTIHQPRGSADLVPVKYPKLFRTYQRNEWQQSLSDSLLHPTMRRHNFANILILFVTMNQKLLAILFLHKTLKVTNLLSLKVVVDFVARHTPRPVPSSLFDQHLIINSLVMQHQDSCRNTEATVHWNNLSSAIDWLSHLQHELNSLALTLKLRRKRPRPIRLLWSILALLNLNAPHDWLSIISISN